jgi:hypothetical protein
MEDGSTAPAPGGAAGPLLIGWREYASFPEWDVRRIKVKVDTGARTSALDVAEYHLRELPGRGLVAELCLALNRRKRPRFKVIETPVLRLARVRNTGGQYEQRPVVETVLRLGPVTRRVCLTVTDRKAMRFRVILGRKALEGDFLVDVSKQYLLKGQ